MTDRIAALPDGWSEASDRMPDAGQTYVCHVSDDERVLVGLVLPSNTQDEIRLEVSSIEEIETIHRHDFVVATYDEKQNGIKDMVSFMEIINETTSSDRAEDDRLFVAIQQCLKEFNTTADT